MINPLTGSQLLTKPKSVRPNKPNHPAMDEEHVKLQTFLQWATDLGISDHQSQPPLNHPDFCLGHSLSLSFFPDDGGRGLAAARDLRKGELVLRVPKCALITSQTLMEEDHKLSLSLKNHPFLSSTQILAVVLLNEVNKGRRSPWYPYLLQMPRSYDTLASFNEFEIKALQLDEAIWTAEEAVEAAKLEWENAIELMKELQLKPQFMSFKVWLWASATISSRTMHVPWDTAGCFCPVGDFFNYATPGDDQTLCENLRTDVAESDVKPDSEHLDASSMMRLTDGVYEEDVGAYCFYARKEYRKGEQVLLSYGTYTNLELLDHYGFLLDENPNDKAFIPLLPDIYSLCSWPKESLFINQNGMPSFALLSTMRLWATLPNQRKSIAHLAYSGSNISTSNERIVLEWISKKCYLNLKNLSTTIEEDKLLLCTIERMLDTLALPMELDHMPPSLSSKILEFLKDNGFVNDLNEYLSRKTLKSLERWKLAVKWRLKYKTILDDCVLYCTRVISKLDSLDNGSYHF